MYSSSLKFIQQLAIVAQVMSDVGTVDWGIRFPTPNSSHSDHAQLISSIKNCLGLSIN
jgi:hypothetical protein